MGYLCALTLRQEIGSFVRQRAPMLRYVADGLDVRRRNFNNFIKLYLLKTNAYG